MGWYLSSFVVTTFELLCCKIFFETFCKEPPKEKKGKRNILILIMIMAAYSDIVLLKNWLLLKAIMVIVIIAYIMYRYFEISVKKSVVIVFLFESLVFVVDYIAYVICNELFLSKEMIEQEHMLEANLIVVFAKIVLFLCVLLIRKIFDKKRADILSDIDWIKFLIFPVFTIIAIAALLAVFPSVEEPMQANVLYTIAIGMVGMNLVVYYLIRDIAEREAQLHEKRLFELQVKEQMEMYRSISENFEKQKQKAHEFKNKILCIDGLVKNQEYGRLKTYVAEISEHLSTEKNVIDSNHAIVNAILNTKYEEAIKKQIIFVFQVNDLSNIWIGDEDLVVLLSNLLNNAIEACEKCKDNKKIQLKFVMEENAIVLSVKNTYTEPVIYEKNEIKTSKSMPEEHGVGIKNIKKIVEKYEGSYTIQNDDREFLFSILIEK